MKVILLFLLSFLFAFSGYSQDRKLRVYLDAKQFYAPTIGNLLEVNLQFAGPSLNYRGLENGLIADVAVFISIEQNGVIIKEDAHRLESPLMKDSIVEDFYDLARFVLAPGEYKINLELKDLLADNPSIKGSMPIKIRSIEGETQISDIQIAEFATPGNESSIFHKSGYEIIPRISTFYPQELDRIPYYAEIYHADLLASPEFGLKQSIIDKETGLELEEYTNYFRYKSAAVVPVLKQLDISQLTSGSYYLQLAVLRQDLSEVYSTAYSFDRSKTIELDLDEMNLILDPAFAESIKSDSAKYYLASIIPITTPDAARKILSTLKSGNAEQASLLIQSFWKATSKASAYEDWMKYKAQVQLVENLYATNFQAGYETDRGRVYLQYGSPTTIVKREASAAEYPYEIWQFNKIGRFSNKRFIFYNPDLLGENYRLLHSDLIGEIKNNNWPSALSARSGINGTIEDGNGGAEEHYGGNSNNLFRQY
jgi:GWxTD domain-containing protein